VLERQQKADAAGAGSRYSEVMRVKVLYFGLLRDVFGAAGEEVELADGAAVRDLLGLLRGRTSKDAMENKTESDADEQLQLTANMDRRLSSCGKATRSHCCLR
jgi:molybdopterin converting factor small subunit